MEQTQKNTDRGTMNPDFFAAKWQQMRGTLRSWWGKLTDDDWERIGGQKDRLIGMLQEKYGYAKDMALREVEQRSQEYGIQSGSGQRDTVAWRATLDPRSHRAQPMPTARPKQKRKNWVLWQREVGGATKTVGEKISSLAGTFAIVLLRQGPSVRLPRPSPTNSILLVLIYKTTPLKIWRETSLG